MEIDKDTIKNEIEKDLNNFMIKELNKILNEKFTDLNIKSNDLNELLLECWSREICSNGLYTDKNIEEIYIKYIKNNGRKNIERLLKEPLDSLIIRLQVYLSSFCMLDSNKLLLNLIKTNYYGTNLLLAYDKLIKLQFNIPDSTENKLIDIVKNDITKDITKFLIKNFNEYSFKELLLLIVLMDINTPGIIHCLFAKNFSLLDIMKHMKNSL